MQIKELEKIFKAFGNKRRLQIIKLLLHNGEKTVSDIAHDIKLSIKSTSRHLHRLNGIDILEKEQRDKNVYYRVDSPHNPLLRQIFSHTHHSAE